MPRGESSIGDGRMATDPRNSVITGDGTIGGCDRVSKLLLHGTEFTVIHRSTSTRYVRHAPPETSGGHVLVGR